MEDFIQFMDGWQSLKKYMGVKFYKEKLQFSIENNLYLCLALNLFNMITVGLIIFHKIFIFELLIYVSIKIIVSRHILSTILVKVLILPTCIIYAHIYMCITYIINTYIICIPQQYKHYDMHVTCTIYTYITYMPHILYIHI